MPFNVLPLVLIILSLTIIIVIVLRKFPHLTSIDILSIAEEKQIAIKEKILYGRLHRRSQELVGKAAPIWNSGVSVLRRVYRGLYQKVRFLEEKYKRSARKISATEKEDTRQQVSNLMEEVQELDNKANFEAVEQKYIKIISVDPKNIEAYQSLADLYFDNKEYQEAEQVLNHLLKLDRDNNQANYYYQLGEIKKITGSRSEALVFAQKAVEAAPANPKYLDFLLEESIAVGNKPIAKETYYKLKEANPENQKLETYYEAIKDL